MDELVKRFSEISDDKSLRERLTKQVMQIVAGSDFSIEERNDMNLTLSYYMALDETFQDMSDNILGETVEYIIDGKEE